MLSIESMRDELELYLEIDFAPFPDEHILVIYDIYRVFEKRQTAGLNAYLTALSSLMRAGNQEIEADTLRRVLESRTNVNEQIYQDNDDEDYYANAV